MDAELKDYRSYLIRLWQVNSEGRAVWRVMLESVQTGERWGFTELPDLCAFLQEKINMPADDNLS